MSGIISVKYFRRNKNIYDVFDDSEDSDDPDLEIDPECIPIRYRERGYDPITGLSWRFQIVAQFKSSIN